MGNDYYPSLEQLETTNGIPPVGIGQRCYINNAIVDKNARIGNDVRINGGDHLKDGHYDNYSVVDGIVIVTKSSVIKRRNRYLITIWLHPDTQTFLY